MGKVRTKTIKKSSRRIIERYYPRLTLDFHTNKRICDDVAEIPTKRMRNKIAGYVTRLMKRIKRGPVKGISIKLQEEEREKRDNYAPEVSIISEKDTIDVDQDTLNMLKEMGMDNLPKLQLQNEVQQTGGHGGRGGRH